MMLEDEVASLRAENAVLREQLTATLARIAESEQQRPDPPAFVKPNRHQTQGNRIKKIADTCGDFHQLDGII